MFRSSLAPVVLVLCAITFAPDASAQAHVGNGFVDFEVTGIDGEKFKLSDKVNSGKNVVLAFSRAHW